MQKQSNELLPLLKVIKKTHEGIKRVYCRLDPSDKTMVICREIWSQASVLVGKEILPSVIPWSPHVGVNIQIGEEVAIKLVLPSFLFHDFEASDCLFKPLLIIFLLMKPEYQTLSTTLS
ncbi:hypothetical protein HanRHA438_Chr09g0424271 [Helianthus annuus]|nr:hypothetical protein HanRHA438_Chr09g0424271 [Helianthus annuus]